MRLLLANPNTSVGLTRRMAAVAGAVAPPDCTIEAVTAPRGFPYVSTRAEAHIAGAVMLEVLAGADADAAIIAAFGDPGLRAARDLCDFPVVGVAEAAMMTAAMLGERFAIVAFTRRMRAWYLDSVRDAGIAARFAGFRAPEIEPRSVEGAQDELREALLACIDAAVTVDGADTVILGGAPLAGLAATLADAAPAPLVDPIAAATLQAAALVRLGAGGRRAAPVAKPSTGLDPDLARRFGGRRAANGHAS